MSARTKSFFDQETRNKPRPGPWHRGQNRTALADKNVNIVPAKPPIPPTSQAKAKLKSFQFAAEHSHAENIDGKEDDGTSENDSHGKHNDAPVPSASADVETAESATHGSQDTEDAPKTLPNTVFPSTPSMRLPLEDLLGNVDVVRRAPLQDQSPEEYIDWIPNSSSNLLTPNRRKRKRARSSSPSCPSTSQRNGTAQVYGEPPTQRDKTTPETDPAAYLWQRYGGKLTDSDARAPNFSHLTFHESPRPLETPVKSAGLRRWASTGNDWHKPRTAAQVNVDLWRDRDIETTGERSRVATMVDCIQQSLATQKLVQAKPNPSDKADGPSSSSPLPDTSACEGFARRTVVSPLVSKKHISASTSNKLNAMSRPQLQTILEAQRSGVKDNPSIPLPSIVPQQLQVALESAISAPLHLQSRAPLPAYKRPCLSRQTSGGGVQYPRRSSQDQPNPKVSDPQPQSLPLDDLDEFAEDLDLSAEDLEELLDHVPPLHERPMHQIPPHPNPPPQHEFRDADIDDHRHGTTRAGAIQIHDDHDDNNDDDDDEFGGDDIDEDAFVQAEVSATQRVPTSEGKPQASRSKQPNSPSLSRIQPAVPQSPSGSSTPLQRCVARQIVESEYTNGRGIRCSEKLLIGEDERSLKTTAITLRDSWAATSVDVGDTIHLAQLPRDSIHNAPPNTPLGQIMLSDADTSPFIIIHPDHMLSATTIADSFDCIRKAVLQDRIKATSDANKAMVYGKILHEIVQQALSSNQWTENFLTDLVERTVLNHLEGLWELGIVDTVLAVEEIRGKMTELAAWARIFVAAEPSEVALVDDRQGEKIWLAISKLIAIEEHVWSPRFGLKGNIDATIQASVPPLPGRPSSKLVMPFEVKTGRATHSPAHRAQTALYTLLLSDRYDVAIEAGILYYLETSAMSRIAPPVFEIRQMLQQRNRLASQIHQARHPDPKVHRKSLAPPVRDIEAGHLPTMLKSPYKCAKCYARQSCFTYHALAEGGSAESAGMVDDGKKDYGLVWKEELGHLRLGAKNTVESEKLKSWFSKWDRLLTFEERDLSRLSKEIWTMDSTEREAAGRCFGNLFIEQDLTDTSTAVSSTIVDGIQGSGGKINRFAYQFVRHASFPGSSFTEGTQLAVGEPIVISSERGQWALANGYIVALSHRHITVAVDRRLGDARDRLPEFDAESIQAFRGIVDTGGRAPLPDANCSTVRYRLDKDEFSNGLALIRNNLVTMMSSHPMHAKLRQQIVLGASPTFSAQTSLAPMPPSQIGQMNEDQRDAVAKVLAANDFALILGMPGTGKTTTIAHLIRALLIEGKTILLTSFTHTAVDNILLKIRDIVTPGSILRLGVPAKINPEVQTFCQLAATPRSSIAEIDEAYMNTQIVATTCMGTNHALFQRRAFDVCIVDEASQITLPTSLGPLLHARKFVLVGDHYQLPPLVQNKAAMEGGLDVSLFRQLSEEHPHAIAKLGEQYRMCEEIMSLSNTLIYDGQLRCGNDAVAQKTLKVADLAALATFHTGPSSCLGRNIESRCWLRRLTAPENKVIFANIDAAGPAALETLTSGKNITNQFEATLSAHLVLALLSAGVPAREVGVITLYRSQLALIRRLFKTAGISSEVEIDSADRFQGRDKECIVLSMVRSNDSGNVGDLLKDWRRVNVALTRARSKLVIFGSRRTLRHNDLLAKLLSLVDLNGWGVDLPEDAVDAHHFAFSSQTASELVVEAALSPLKGREPSSQDHGMFRSTVNSPPKAIRPSQTTAAGRSPFKVTRQNRKAAKSISGKGSIGGTKARKVKEQIAWEIFEDLTADDI